MEIVCLVFALIGLGTTSDAIFVVLLLLHLAMGFAQAWKLKSKQPLTALFLTAYGPMYFLNPIAIHLGWLELDSTPEALQLSNVLMMVGLDLFVFAARRLRWGSGDLQDMQPVAIDESRLNTAFWVAVAVYGVASLVQIVGVSSGERSAFDLTKSEIASAGDHSILFMIARVSSMAIPFAGFFASLKPWKKQSPYLITLFFCLMLHFVLFRVRQVPIATAQAYVIGMFAGRVLVSVAGRQLQVRLPRHMVLMALVMIPTIALAAIGIRWVRGMYSYNTWNFSAESRERIFVSTFQAGDLSVSYMTRKAVEKFPSEHPYFNGAGYYRLLFTPIPRSIWPDKPQTTQREFAAVISPKDAALGLTVPAGVVGDLYVNFGVLGVFGMVVLGVAFGQERYRTLTPLLVLATSGAWIFHFTRGSQTGPLVILLIQYVFARFFTLILAPKPIDKGQALAGQFWWAWVPHVQGQFRQE